MTEQKKITKAYFDEVSKDWFRRAYDPENTFIAFPTGKVRQDITISEMKKLNTGKRVIDLGCGIGQLVIELLKAGYDVIGIDNSPKMIVEARNLLAKELPRLNGSKIFQIRDCTNQDINDRFDVVTAMGLLEYLEDDFAFFEAINSLLKDKGFAFIECRNRLFNINSGNQYILKESESGDLKELILQLDSIEKYSPVSIKEIVKIQATMFKEIAENIEKEYNAKILTPDDIPVFKEYPTKMVRKQYTPKELEELVKKAGLKLKYVVYYHCHPYLPRYEKLFPTVFNRIAFLMQPLGYTPLGSTICSAFVAVIEKT